MHIIGPDKLSSCRAPFIPFDDELYAILSDIKRKHLPIRSFHREIFDGFTIHFT